MCANRCSINCFQIGVFIEEILLQYHLPTVRSSQDGNVIYIGTKYIFANFREPGYVS